MRGDRLERGLGVLAVGVAVDHHASREAPPSSW